MTSITIGSVKMTEGPDGVRSWFVAFSALIINIIEAGSLRSQGIFFVAFLNVFKINRQKAALPFAVLIAFKNLMGPVVGILGQKYGVPIVIISGAIMGCLSFILCYFAPDIMWITVFLGGMYGTSFALMIVLPQVVIGQYFAKHRATACGLSYSGGCIGALILPLLLEMSLQYYGLSGTFIIMAGIILHIIPAAMLLKKPPWMANLERGKKYENAQKTENVVNICINRSQTYPNVSSGIRCTCNEECNEGDTTIDICKDIYIISTRNTLEEKHILAHDIHVNDSYERDSTSDIANMGPNSRKDTLNSDYIFDIDFDYLKGKEEIVFQMISKELSNTELLHRKVLPQTEIDIWHPDRNEIMQEIENIYLHIEKILEKNYISEDTIKINNLHMKRILLKRKLPLKEIESSRGDNRSILSFTGRKFQFGKIRTDENISKICNNFVRMNYIMSKMKVLYNSNELHIIRLLSQYNVKDVQRVFSQIRNLYRLYSDLKFADNCGSSGMYKKISIKQRDEIKDEDNIEINTINIKQKSVENTLCKTTKNTFSHHIKATFKLHTDPIFLLICLGRTVFHLTFATVLTIVVDFAMDNGLEKSDGKYVIGALSFGDLIGRLGLGWITDQGFVTLPRYMFVVTMMQGLCTILLPLMHSRWTILPSIALFGLINGSLFIQQSVLIVKQLQPKKQSIAAGCLDFSGGFIGLILPSYIGFFRDKIGSYNPTFYINGTIALFSGISWFFEPYIRKKWCQQSNS